MSPSTDRPFLFVFCRGALLLMFKLFHRWEVHGTDHVPAQGGCLLAANHVSFLDPPALGCSAMHRIVRFMARDTLFKKGFGHWFMTGVAAIPISRDRGDVGAIKRCIQLLKSGDCVGIFPEGTRSRTGELGPAKGGIGLLIASAAVPVVPVYIHGTRTALPRGGKWPKPHKVTVFVGPPILPPEFAHLGRGRESYEKIGQLVMDRIRALRPENSQ